MKRIVLVGCGAAKCDCDQCEARELYTSNYFKLKRAYAEELGDEWIILSATGPLLPDEIVEPYDLRITRSGFEGETEPNHDDLESWANDVSVVTNTLVEHLDHSVEIVVLAGRTYVEPIRERLEAFEDYHETVSVRFPFDDTSGIGEQMGWCKQQVDSQSTE